MRQVTCVHLAAVLICIGCTDHKTYTSVSPDGKATIRIIEPGMIRSGFRIEYHEGRNEAELYRIRGDRFFSLAEVYWSPDSKVVGVFTCGEPFVRIAYDRSTLKSVPFSTVESGIRGRIRSRFNVPAGEDPFIYPCLNAGTEEHRKRFGDLGIKRGG